MTNHDTPQQLTLLPSPDVPVQFRLDAETRRRGLQHIAEIRLQLAARQAARATVQQLPTRQQPQRSTAA
jgi:hypothetical protein